MVAFLVYNPTDGVIKCAYTTSDIANLAEITAANTPAGYDSLAVPIDSPVVRNQVGWIIQSGQLVAVAPTADELLANAKTAQHTIIENSYALFANSGFTSTALGSSYLYPSTPVDQANLTAVVTASLIPTQPANWTALFLCAPDTPPLVWNYVAHTATQIHQVGIDALAFIMNMKLKRAQLLGQIEAATTVAAVQAIVW
jgi:hypothetical protein